MARPLRIEFEGATYHVTSRGNRREQIVRDDHDRQRWLDWVERVVERYRWELFAFCLLDNHYHLFLSTPLPNLSAGMLTLNGSYTSYHNRRHRQVGHLFQGRYRAHLVETGQYFDALSRYIHLNPVRAGLCQRPDEWTWSSCPGYWRASLAKPWLAYDKVLAAFGDSDPKRRRQYRRFVEAGLSEPPPSPLADAVHGFLLGGDAWIARIRHLLRESAPPQQAPAHRQVTRLPIAQIAAAVASHYAVSPECFSLRGTTHVARSVFAHLCRQDAQASLRELAPWLGLKSAGSVDSLLRRFLSANATSPQVQADIAAIRHAFLKQKNEP
jgi:REP-associated tyrosine transposase